MRRPISCSTRAVLNRIGDQWSCLIIQTLLGGTHRFGELKAAIEGISPRVLSQTLNSLHRDGLIERKAYPTIPPRVEYTNTLSDAPSPKRWGLLCDGQRRISQQSI
jgi:DNA-binding HxlR family transcriptional regulator